MAQHYDVIVVGAGGAMGSATCFELARRGAKVLGLDRFGVAHNLGSSHGYSRLIRLAYYEHPDYVPLLRRAYERWRELEQLSSQRILQMTGGVYCGPPGCELVARSHEAALQHGLDHEMLDRNAIAHRFPQLRLPHDFVGIFEPTAGFLRPERAIALHAKHAMIAGAEIHGHEPLREWSAPSNAPVRVVTDRATYTCDRIVFAGGSWTGKLVRDLNTELRVTRQVMGWVWPSKHADYSLGTFTCWAIQQPDGSLYYGMPMSPDEPGLKVAHHKPGESVDPDTVSREPTTDDADAINRIIDTTLPGAAGPIVSMRVCLYTNSPDGHFIVGPNPRDPRVILACGFSGHGFKFASVIGEILADLAQQGSTKLPIAFLSPDRFPTSTI